MVKTKTTTEKEITCEEIMKALGIKGSPTSFFVSTKKQPGDIKKRKLRIETVREVKDEIK